MYLASPVPCWEVYETVWTVMKGSVPPPALKTSGAPLVKKKLSTKIPEVST